jgi:hypothetical protein
MAKKKPEVLKRRRKVYESAALISALRTCEMTGFSPAFTYRLLHAGKLRGAVMINGRWWVHVGKLRAWLEELGKNAA